MSYNSTVLAVREVLRQTVHNLDVQRDALTTAATQADRDFNTTDHHRYLVEAFRELERARAHLVNVHSEISATVPGHITQEEPIR